jgi:hypothetical protein
VIGQTKIVVDDFLDYLGTRFSKEIKFGLEKFFKVWDVQEEFTQGEMN